jgi:hypothetical protein
MLFTKWMGSLIHSKIPILIKKPSVNKLEEVDKSSLLEYILASYPNKSTLPVSRLAGIVYLSDWKSAIEKNAQITNMAWRLDHSAPYVDDFLKIAKNDPEINVVNAGIASSEKNKHVELRKYFHGNIKISVDDKEILDFVIKKTKDKSYAAFMRLINSTYPVILSKPNGEINMVKMAGDYRQILLQHDLL